MRINNHFVRSVGFATVGLAIYAAGRFNAPRDITQAAFASSPPEAAKLGDAGDLNIFVSLSKRAIPSVVNISTVSTVKASLNSDNPEDILRRFFGGGMGVPQLRPILPPSKMPKQSALGTGFIVDSSGIILTNNHVVAGADQIKIQFTENPEETPTEGKVIGRDPELDVALIKVNTQRKLVSLPLGDSDALQVGEYVMAVGNPYGNGHSVSHGIVSAKGRLSPVIPLATYLQIDAPINPGNSGGPLMNLKGEVVGINNAIDARAQGIGYAIPINYVKKVLTQLQTNGRVDRGYIGAVVGALTPDVAEKMGVDKELRAPFVVQVNPGTPAEKAGLKPYDVVTEVNGAKVMTPNDLVFAITSAPVGKSVPVKINRQGTNMTLSIETAVRPGENVASAKSDSHGSNEDSLSSAGLYLKDLSPEQGKGIIINGVEPGSAAEQAGLYPGDVILEVDRKEVKDVRSLAQILKPNKSYLIRVRRGESEGPSLFSVVVLNLQKDKAQG